jgi:type I site-specific restriction endonuclease
LLEKLGYDENDIAIGYPVNMFEGVQRTTKEADFVLFNGPTRERKDILLIIEAKKGGKRITVDYIGQVKSYSRELLPACYIITNGQQIIVFQFNGMLYQDERVMDFDRSMLNDMWKDLYKYVSKESTIKRKSWMREKFQNQLAT